MFLLCQTPTQRQALLAKETLRDWIDESSFWLWIRHSCRNSCIISEIMWIRGYFTAYEWMWGCCVCCHNCDMISLLVQWQEGPEDVQVVHYTLLHRFIMKICCPSKASTKFKIEELNPLSLSVKFTLWFNTSCQNGQPRKGDEQWFTSRLIKPITNKKPFCLYPKHTVYLHQTNNIRIFSRAAEKLLLLFLFFQLPGCAVFHPV